MIDCKQGNSVNYCRVHASTWESYDDNTTPCDLSRAWEAEAKIALVRSTCKTVLQEAPDLSVLEGTRIGFMVEELTALIEKLDDTLMGVAERNMGFAEFVDRTADIHSAMYRALAMNDE